MRGPCENQSGILFPGKLRFTIFFKEACSENSKHSKLLTKPPEMLRSLQNHLGKSFLDCNREPRVAAAHV